MPVIYTEERTIGADCSTVYRVITDFAAYPQWNPWIVAVAGKPVPGSQVTATVKSLHSHYRVRHRVLVAEAPLRFSWCDSGWFTFLARGERRRLLTPLPGGGCHYHCELHISGPLASLVDALFGHAMRSGLAAEAEALARRAAWQAHS